MASGVELATAYVTLAVSTRGMGKDVSREFAGVERDATGAGKRAGKNFHGGMVGSLKVLGGIGAAIGVADFLGDAIGEARESQKVGAITSQVIKATGGAAKVTSKQVGDLSTQISNKTGVDDEAIQAGANMLLTFKNVRNEAGKGAKVFDRATAAAADLSAAGFGDMATTSKQLGKALNDPVKGIAALGKSGVTFTDQQKAQIKTLVKSGDTLGAQKIILKEIEGQVGGTAEASATAGEKLATSFGNFKEGIGNALLPALDTVFTKGSEVLGWLTENIGPALKKIGDFVGPVFETVKTGIEAFFSAFEEGDVTSDGFVGFMETIGDFLYRTLPGAIETAKGFITNTLIPAFTAVKDFIVNTLVPAFGRVVDFIKVEVIPRIADIAETIRKFVEVAVPIVRDFVKGMIDRIQPMIPTIQDIFGTIGDIITGALDLIKAIIERVTGIISWVWENWGTGIMNFIADIWEKILAIIGPAFEGIRSLFATFTSLFKGDWEGVWEGLKGTFNAAWKIVRGAIDLALGLLGTALSIAWAGIVSAAGTAWDGIVGAISGPVDRALQFIQENLIDKINGMFAFLKLPIHIEPIWKASNVGTGMSFKGAGKGTANKLGKKGFAGGGVLPGWSPGRDIHEFFSATGGRLALSGGEAIMRPEFTRAVGGKRGIDLLNRAARRGQAFANGGVFEAVRNVASSVSGLVTDPVGSIKELASRILGGVGDNPMSRLVAGLVGRVIPALIQKVQDLFGGGIPANATMFGGQRVDADTARRLRAAGGLKVIQGSWSHNPLSQGTHAGAGAVDVVASDWGAAVARLRAQGLLAMFRNWTGNQHIHALNPFVQGLSPQALAQVKRARANGGIFADGGVIQPRLMDQGGFIAPGRHVIDNKLSHSETVLPYDIRDGGLISEDLIDRLADRIGQRVERGAYRGISQQAQELSIGARY